MDLTLTVIEAPQDVNMVNHTKAFKSEGGSLGRADRNTWVLPCNERIVSSTHAEISFQNGTFFLSDLSTNGTYHNDSDSPIGESEPSPLSTGDTLKIGNYKIMVSIKNSEKSLPKGLDSADFLDSEDKTTFTPAVKDEHESLAKVAALDEFLDSSSSQQSNQSSTSAQNSLWDSVPTSALVHASNTGSIDNRANPDPLAAFSNSGTGLNDRAADVQPGNLDPMSQWERPTESPATPQWLEDDDDWWREGSQADNSSALAQAVPEEIVSPPNHLDLAPAASAQSSATISGGLPDQASTPPTSDQPLTLQSLGTVENSGTPPTTEQPPQQAQHLHQQAPLPSQQTERPQTPVSGNTFAEHAALDTPATINPTKNPVVGNPVGTVEAGPTDTEASHQSFTQTATPAHVQNSDFVLPNQAPNSRGAETQNKTAQKNPPTVSPQNTQHIQQLAQTLGLGDLPAQQLQSLVPEASSIISETLTRLMDLLRARSSIKNELRVQRTMIQATDNNPLKFSASAQDALRIMFSPGNQAYLNPHMAVKDSFDDLSDHQVAVLAGMRAAYDSMLSHFDPDNLDRRFNNSNSMLSNKKAKNWEAFQQHFASLTRDGEAAYDMLFGDEFSSTYEKQLSELKNARSLTQPR